MEQIYENSLLLGSLSALKEVCEQCPIISLDGYKSVKLPHYNSFNIKLITENKTYYCWVHGKEVFVLKNEKSLPLEVRQRLWSAGIFDYLMPNEQINSIDIKMENPSKVSIFANDNLIAQLVSFYQPIN